VQRRLYVAPEGASALDVFENYRSFWSVRALSAIRVFRKGCGSGNMPLLARLLILPERALARNLGNILEESNVHLRVASIFWPLFSGQMARRHVALYVAKNQKGPDFGTSVRARGSASGLCDIGSGWKPHD